MAEKDQWKWAVLAAAFFNNFFIWGLAFGAGVFQVIFAEEFGEATSSGLVSFIPSLISGWTSFIGPLSSLLTNRYGCRNVTCAGALLVFFSLVITSISTQLWHLYITFSILGIGLGLAFIPGGVTVVCQYFERSRSTAFAVASCGVGVGTLCLPLIIRLLVNVYEWRGACLILAALTLHMAVGAAVFFPPKPSTTLAVQQTEKSAKTKLLRVKMLRRMPFVCLLLNQTMVLYGIVSFYIHLPALLGIRGFSDDAGAVYVSAIGASTLLGRLLCAVMKCGAKTPAMVYAGTMTMAGAAVLALPHFEDHRLLLLLCLIFGVASSTLGPLLPLIATELLGENALSDAYGYLMVAEGVGSLLGPPLAGMWFDVTSDYRLSMGISGMALIFAAFPMVPLLRETGHSSAKEKIFKVDELNEKHNKI